MVPGFKCHEENVLDNFPVSSLRGRQVRNKNLFLVCLFACFNLSFRVSSSLVRLGFSSLTFRFLTVDSSTNRFRVVFYFALNVFFNLK